jgi:hypothetical protein
MKMTKETILAMSAGRELDALVAVRVMEFSDWWKKGNDPIPNYIPHFTTNLSDAFQVVDKLSKEQYPLTMDNNHWEGHFDCGFYVDDVTLIQAEAPTAPEAICKAALLAFGSMGTWLTEGHLLTE